MLYTSATSSASPAIRSLKLGGWFRFRYAVGLAEMPATHEALSIYRATKDQNKAITATAISAVPIQPRAISQDLPLNLPISLEFATITITIAMIGNAAMPYGTAMRNSIRNE